MADFTVDPAQLTRHAAKIRAVGDQLNAVTAASRAISQDDAAYGVLCGWISAILESRHSSQDRLYAVAQQNLALAADALTGVAANYEASDSAAADRISKAGGSI